ncbi:MAG: MarR family transcriptional regulator [Oscillospiraceae bacterium]|nr:MarR family transcriptional regulator [Oscillospiraceae bacterium]
MTDCHPGVPEHFGPLLGYCDHRIQTLMGRRLRQYDVSPMQCRTLTFLHNQTGEVNQKMLERHLMVKPSTVNGIVDRLEEKGLVRRTTAPSDGRCRILTLTERGIRFYDDLTDVVGRVTRQMEQGFSDQELETLKSCLLRVAHNLSREEDAEQ